MSFLSAMHDPKKLLSITLAEPVVFLRSSDPSGRHQPDPNDQFIIVRAILNLNVVKPIAISSIEVELSGMLTILCPDGNGSHSIELPEKRKIYSSTVTVFRPDQVSHGRRPASVGPGLSAANSSNDDEHATTTLSRPSPPRGRPERRSVSTYPRTLLPTDVNIEPRTRHVGCDNTLLTPLVAVTGVRPDLGPTPPYTAVAHSPTPIQSRLGASGENPAQTLEELRQVLRGNLEGEAYRNGLVTPSSRPHSIAFSLLNPTTHSNASSTSNDSLHRENDNGTDDMAQTSPSFEGDTSFHNTAEEPPYILPHSGLSSSSPSRAHSPENIHGTQPCTRGNSRDSSNTPAGRSRLRLSLTSALHAVMEVTSRAQSKPRGVARLEERDRGRTRVRTVAGEQSRASILEGGEDVAGTGNGNQLGANAPHPNGHMEHREHHLLGLGRILTLERDHEKEKDGEQKFKEHGAGWKEFKPGTYSYPISFLLPPNLPPTLSVPHGSLNYAIKGVAHRPGTFTSKLSCQIPLLVIAAPAIGTGEGGVAGDPGPLFVEKQWGGNLAYSFGLSSRLFLLGAQRRLEAAASEGISANTESLVEADVEARAEAAYGTTILDLTLLPLEKIKIWKLSVVVDQRVRYIDGRGRLWRDDDKMRVTVLEVQDTCLAEEMDLADEEAQTHKNKHKNKRDFVEIPLLPTPISPHRSPLLRYIPPSTDPSVLAGPGPYTLSTSIGLPGCSDPSGSNSGLHFTVKQKCLGIRVEHFLRLIMRVERISDEGTNDHEEGDKKRLFDIAIQAPIAILSCRCVPEYQTLPRYSPVTEDGLQNSVACPCQPSVAGPTEQGHGHQLENHSIPFSSTSSLESEDGAGHFHRRADEPRNGHECSRSSSHARRNGHPSSLTTPPAPPHPPSPANRAHDAGWNIGSSSVHTQTHPHDQHHHSRSQSYTVSTSHVRAHSRTPISTPYPSRPPSPLAQYERLVSGLESEVGEAPPSYESISSSV